MLIADPFQIGNARLATDDLIPSGKEVGVTEAGIPSLSANVSPLFAIPFPDLSCSLQEVPSASSSLLCGAE